jgi:hypothetical protein
MGAWGLASHYQGAASITATLTPDVCQTHLGQTCSEVRCNAPSKLVELPHVIADFAREIISPFREGGLARLLVFQLSDIPPHLATSGLTD